MPEPDALPGLDTAPKNGVSPADARDLSVARFFNALTRVVLKCEPIIDAALADMAEEERSPPAEPRAGSGSAGSTTRAATRV